jgi:hypothetical protein
MNMQMHILLFCFIPFFKFPKVCHKSTGRKSEMCDHGRGFGMFWEGLSRKVSLSAKLCDSLFNSRPWLVENFIREGNARYVLENNGFSPGLQPACYPDEPRGLTLAKGMLAEF